MCLVVLGVVDSTFRRSSSAWRRASAFADRVAWMRVLRAAASMMGECRIQMLDASTERTKTRTVCKMNRGPSRNQLQIVSLVGSWKCSLSNLLGFRVRPWHFSTRAGAKPKVESCPTLPPATPGHTTKQEPFRILLLARPYEAWYLSLHCKDVASELDTMAPVMRKERVTFASTKIPSNNNRQVQLHGRHALTLGTFNYLNTCPTERVRIPAGAIEFVTISDIGNDTPSWMFSLSLTC